MKFKLQTFGLYFLLTAAEIYEAKLNTSSPFPKLIQLEPKPSRPTLTLGTVLALSGLLPMGHLCTEPMRIALEALRNASILENYNLVLEITDDTCLRPPSIRATLAILNGDGNEKLNRVPVILGPMCLSQTEVAMLPKYFNFIGITSSAIVLGIFTMRQRYSSFYVTPSPSPEVYFQGLAPFIHSNGWSKVFLLTDSLSEWSSYDEILFAGFAKLNITVGGTAKILRFAGVPPANDNFRDAVRELKGFDPRIIIVNTDSGALAACWLYHFGLFGPNFVQIFHYYAAFLPSTPPPPVPGCTKEVLSIVLESVIFSSPARPIFLNPHSVDTIGLTGRLFDELLKDRIENPELDAMWAGRTVCYEQVVAAALTLHSVDETLRLNNHSLIDWTSNSDNFHLNGSYIHGLFKNAIEHLRYGGIGAKVSGPNARNGEVAFLQMQPTRAGILTPIPVVTFDSSNQNASVVSVGRYMWRTVDGNAPFDELQTVLVSDDHLHGPGRNSILGISSAFLLITVGLLITTWHKRRHKTIATSMPIMNSLMLVGDILIILAVILLSTQRYSNITYSCTAASLLMITGHALLTWSIAVKMNVATVIAQKMDESSKLQLRMSVKQAPSHPTLMRVISGIAGRQPNSPVVPAEVRQVFKNMSKYAAGSSIVWALLQFLCGIIWFSLAPLKAEDVKGRFEISPANPSLAYQHHNLVCSLDITSSVTITLLAVLASSYVVVLLRSAWLGYCLRKAPPLLLALVNDILQVRTASYCIGLIVVAGAIIASVFSGDAVQLEIAICSLALSIVAINVGLLFSTKILSLFKTSERHVA